MTPDLYPASLDIIDGDHYNALDKAIKNVLCTDLAEFTYAQILDGLPTLQSFEDSYIYLENHPVYALDHTDLCEGALEKAKAFRSQFDLSRLRFRLSALRAFQANARGSVEYNLRLIELVVVACHQIGAHLFEQDHGVHKHAVHQKWTEQERLQVVHGVHRNGYPLPPSAFFHMAYVYPEQYPRGIADVVGYWAESKIFGGVVVFDRGESEKECKSMWIHGGFIGGPKTLYPPTKKQFDSIIRFLLADSGQIASCPLHIRGTRDNRPRWDPYDSFAKHHIFRDRYERKLPPGGSWLKGHRQSTQDWPELLDQHFLAEQAHAERRGIEVDKAEVEAAVQRLKEVTPSSPLWRPG